MDEIKTYLRLQYICTKYDFSRKSLFATLL